MIVGQILIYRFNGLHNAKVGVPRNHFTIRDVTDVNEFKGAVHDALDEVPPGKGYVLIKWKGLIYIAEKDVCNPQTDYIRHQVKYHPLMDRFSI